MSAERRGWTRGWDLKGAATGFVFVGAGVVLVRRDDAGFDALPGLLVVGVMACALLAVTVARLDGVVGDAVGRALTRRRARRRGARVVTRR